MFPVLKFFFLNNFFDLVETVYYQNDNENCHSSTDQINQFIAAVTGLPNTWMIHSLSQKNPQTHYTQKQNHDMELFGYFGVEIVCLVYYWPFSVPSSSSLLSTWFEI